MLGGKLGQFEMKITEEKLIIPKKLNDRIVAKEPLNKLKQNSLTSTMFLKSF